MGPYLFRKNNMKYPWVKSNHQINGELTEVLSVGCLVITMSQSIHCAPGVWFYDVEGVRGNQKCESRDLDGAKEEALAFARPMIADIALAIKSPMEFTSHMSIQEIEVQVKLAVLNCEIQGMIAENTQSIQWERQVQYSEDAFAELGARMTDLLDLLQVIK